MESKPNHYPSLSFSSCGDVSEPTTPPPPGPAPLDKSHSRSANKPPVLPVSSTGAIGGNLQPGTSTNTHPSFHKYSLSYSSPYSNVPVFQQVMTPPEDGPPERLNGGSTSSSSSSDMMMDFSRLSVGSHSHQYQHHQNPNPNQYHQYQQNQYQKQPRHQSSVSFDSSFTPGLLPGLRDGTSSEQSRFFYNDYSVTTQPPSPSHITAATSNSTPTTRSHHQRGQSKSILQAEITDDEFPILVRRESYTQSQSPLATDFDHSHANTTKTNNISSSPFDSAQTSPLLHQRRTHSVSGTPFVGFNQSKFTPRAPYSDVFVEQPYRSYFPPGAAGTAGTGTGNTKINGTPTSIQHQPHLGVPPSTTATTPSSTTASINHPSPELIHHRSTGSLPQLSNIPPPPPPTAAGAPPPTPSSVPPNTNSAVAAASTASSNTSPALRPKSSKQSIKREESATTASNNSSTASANRFANVELESFVGDIYSLCKDQHGCRFLQKKLEEKNEKYMEIIFKETYPHVIELMTDPFGNYLCQKLLEYANDSQRTLLVKTASPDLVKIALNQHGTRALQKMIDYINLPEQVDLIVAALEKNVVRLIKDLNGNHVVQKCLNRLSNDGCQFIFDAVSENCVTVGTHRHGCCVLQRCIDHASEAQKQQLVQEIIQHANTLVQDPFGNYVTQYVLDLDRDEFTTPLVEQFVGSVCHLSMQKFSSNVVEKCLRLARPEMANKLIEELISSGPQLERLLRDSFANYVIQTALDFAEPGSRQRLVDNIRPIMPLIKTTPYGRRIQSKLAAGTGSNITGPTSV